MSKFSILISLTETDNSWASILIIKKLTGNMNMQWALIINVGNLLSMERFLGHPVDFSASTIHCLRKLISLFGWLSVMSLSGGTNCQSSVTSALQLELQDLQACVSIQVWPAPALGLSQLGHCLGPLLEEVPNFECKKCFCFLYKYFLKILKYFSLHFFFSLLRKPKELRNLRDRDKTNLNK